MNDAHLHLLFNHLPIVGLAFSLLALIVSLALSNAPMRRLSFMLFVAAALAAIPAFLTGEPAEEQIEHSLPDADAQMETHEDQGKIALWTCIAVGVVALFGLYADYKNMAFVKTIAIALLIGGLANLLFMYRVGNSGGEIRHTEIRAGQAIVPINNAVPTTDDDD